MAFRWEDLEKAHRNLRQIYLYLLATIQDTPIDPALDEQLQETQRLCRSIAERLHTLAEQNGVSGDPASLPTGPPGATTLDRSKLQSIAGYLEKMGRWLDGALEMDVAPRSAGKLGELVAIADAMEALLEQARAGSEAPTPAEQPLRASDFAPSGPEPVEVPEMPPLELEHTFREPLLRGIEGKFELTQRAVRLIDEFLAAAGLSFTAGERRRFDRQVVRWLEATPEGMILTLRIGGLSGRPEPYPRYHPRKKDVNG